MSTYLGGILEFEFGVRVLFYFFMGPADQELFLLVGSDGETKLRTAMICALVTNGIEGQTCDVVHRTAPEGGQLGKRARLRVVLKKILNAKICQPRSENVKISYIGSSTR